MNIQMKIHYFEGIIVFRLLSADFRFFIRLSSHQFNMNIKQLKQYQL